MELSAPSTLLSYCSSSQGPQPLIARDRVSYRTLTATRLKETNLLSRLKETNFLSTPPLMNPLRVVSCASSIDENGSPIASSSIGTGRIGEVKRVTKETNVMVSINLDGSGVAQNDTGIPFLDHMLDQLATHGLFDVCVKATGDTHIDDHHTNEDVALALGTSLLRAIGSKEGIYRFGDFAAPLDEALIHVSLDLSGRPHLSYDLHIPTERVGKYDTQLVEHFFQSLVNTSGMTLHIRQLAGKNSHHIIEATFKAFSKALRQAVEYDPRRRGTVPRYSLSIFTTHSVVNCLEKMTVLSVDSKGVLTRS